MRYLSDKNCYQEWFDFIYSQEMTGFIKMRSGKIQRFANIKNLRGESKRGRQINAHYFTKNNFFISLCSYRSAIDGSQRNLSGLQGFQIDIDFKKIEEYKNFTHEQIIWILENDYFNQSIPVPNLIEFSNNLRLIYIFDEVVGATKKSILLINKVIGKLTEQVKELGGDKQTVNSMVRLPGTINTKTGDVVQSILYSTYKYTLSEMLDGWIGAYIAKVGVSKKGVVFKSRKTYCTAIMGDLEKLITLRSGDMEGVRANFMYIYSSMMLTMGAKEEEIEKVLTKLNFKFKKPLRSHMTKVSKQAFRFKNETIIEKLNITRSEIEQLSIIIDKEEKKKRRAQRHKDTYKPKTKRLDKKESMKAEVFDLRKKGLKQKEIALRLGISLPTVKKYMGELKKEGKINS